MKILMATDGSKDSLKALTAAIDLANRFDAELHVITVEEKLQQHSGSVVSGELRHKEEVKKYLHRLIVQAGIIATSRGLPVIPHVASGHEVQTIVRYLEEHKFDLLIVGFMGHSKIFGNEWGSTSQNLTCLAPCSVLVVK